MKYKNKFVKGFSFLENYGFILSIDPQNGKRLCYKNDYGALDVYMSRYNQRAYIKFDSVSNSKQAVGDLETEYREYNDVQIELADAQEMINDSSLDPDLRDFADAGLSICGQIVLCKGINDGDELLRSMNDLAQLYPNLSSVSIVPAGLTSHRDGLYPLEDFTSDDARYVIEQIDRVAEKLKARIGSRLFFAADEFYLKAALPLPSAEYYEGYPQIENGVGMIRSFEEDFKMGIEDAETADLSWTVSLVTGVAAYPLIRACADKICDICPKMKINVYKIINKFYGESITVAGLLTGKDIYEQLLGKDLGDVLFVPDVALRANDDDFLCGMTRSELADKLSVKVLPMGNDGYEFAMKLLGKDVI